MTIDNSQQDSQAGAISDPYVVFGYGSLIFRVRRSTCLTNKLTLRLALVDTASTTRRQREYVFDHQPVRGPSSHSHFVAFHLIVVITAGCYYYCRPRIPQRLRTPLCTEIARPSWYAHSTLFIIIVFLCTLTNQVLLYQEPRTRRHARSSGGLGCVFRCGAFWVSGFFSLPPPHVTARDRAETNYLL